MAGSKPKWFVKRSRSLAAAGESTEGPHGLSRSANWTMALLSAFGHDKRHPQTRTTYARDPRAVVELEVTSMSAGYRDDQRQAQSRAGLIAAIFQAHKAFDHSRAVGFTDSRARVGNGKLYVTG
jgi:hypothetical protein